MDTESTGSSLEFWGSGARYPSDGVWLFHALYCTAIVMVMFVRKGGQGQPKKNMHVLPPR